VATVLMILMLWEYPYTDELTSALGRGETERSEFRVRNAFPK